jgi:(R)-2-hydroxyacyl-CoA dehydratese activating ATPase
MLVAGVDVGSATSKAVILVEGEIRGSAIIPTGHHVAGAADEVLRISLEKAGANHVKPDYVISTGYGRRSIPYADKTVTEIICHAKGAIHLLPETRTIIDIGGQDSKIIRVDEHGNVNDFVMNDKCAAGTGRFLEVMARVLDLGVDELGAISLTSRKPCHISSTCTVFAESEMVSLRAEGENREDLVAGIITAVSKRVVVMGSSGSFKETVTFTGGVAKNIGAKATLEKLLGVQVSVPYEPQLIGALGAALIAESVFKNDNV